MRGILALLRMTFVVSGRLLGYGGAGVLALMAVAAGAQARVVGYVPTADAGVTSALMVSGEKTVLGGSSVVTAGDRTARVTLDRGGAVNVCSTSVLHLTAAQEGGREGALLLALDRGAMEIRMELGPQDAVMTPDLRFTSAEGHSKHSPLDLALRVTPNGDTCVENRGKKGPGLAVSDVFGEGTYLVKAGQHVLFEHGSLKEVVDREREPCGCPAGMSLADAALHKGDTQPFPTAVSEGLAPPGPVPEEKPGTTKVQVSGTLSYDPGAEAQAIADGTRPAVAMAPTPDKPAAVPAKPGVFASVGHFFKRIFVR